jgi:predicted dehydrogenase
MADTFLVGIIGAGGISNAHIAAAKASGGRVSVAAVADPIAANRARVATETGATAFEHADDLIMAAGELGLDGVVVCTPPSARIPIVAAALKAKLPVLSEKPIAHTLADAKKLAGLAAKHKSVPAFVGYCHRFAPAVLSMKAMVAAGKIGRLVRVENAFACDLPGHEGKWFSDPKKAGGGAFLDMGSHSIDLFHFIAGPGKTVGAIFDHKWKKRTETAASVLLKSTKAAGANIKPGVSGVILSGWAESSRFVLTLVGDAGSLSYDYEKPAEIVFKDLLGKAESMAVEAHDVRFTRQLVAFADAVQKKAKKTGLATFADGLAAAAMNDVAAKLASKK